MGAGSSMSHLLHFLLYLTGTIVVLARYTMSPELIWIVPLTILAAVLIYCWRRRHLYRAAAKYDGPPSWPLIGSALCLWGAPEDFLDKINMLVCKYRAPCRFWFGPKLLLCFQKPEHLEKLLASSKLAQKDEIYDMLKEVVGEGLITASGPTYKAHRRILQPLFNINFCKDNVGIFQKHIEICMTELNTYVGKGYFDIHYPMQHCFADIIGEVFLGIDIDAQHGHNSHNIQAFTDVYKIVPHRIMKVWLHSNWIYNWTSFKSEQVRVTNIMRSFVSQAVTESWKRRKIIGDNQCKSIVDKIGQFIEQNPGKITSEDLVSHLITFYLASEDTMTMTVSFLCLCLGIHPQYQNKLADEIRSIFGDKPRPVTYEDISKASYLDMCIKETLRLFPIGPFILRKVAEPIQIDKYVLPKDSSVIISIFNLHRDSRYWTNPLDFYPDHFLPEQTSKRPSHAYLPFSAGVRNCIGKIVANMSLKMMMCNLLQRYEFQAGGKIGEMKLKLDISVRPVNGYMVKMRDRTWN